MSPMNSFSSIKHISFWTTLFRNTASEQRTGKTTEAYPGRAGYFSGIVILIVVAAVVIIYLYLEWSGPFRLPSEGAAQS